MDVKSKLIIKYESCIWFPRDLVTTPNWRMHLGCCESSGDKVMDHACQLQTPKHESRVCFLRN